MEGRGLHSKGLTEDTLSVLRDGGNNGNEISKNSWDIGNIKTSYIYISVPLDNEDMLKQCHKELDGNKAVGIDKVTKDEYGKNLDRNIKELVQRLQNKSLSHFRHWGYIYLKEMERSDH